MSKFTDELKENLETFTGAMSQEIKNAATNIKDDIEDKLNEANDDEHAHDNKSTKEDDGDNNNPVSGCFSNILGAIIWILIIAFIANKCGLTDSFNILPESPNNTTGSYIGYISSQIDYANDNGIELNRFYAKEKALAEWLENYNDNMVYVTIDYNLLSEDQFKGSEQRQDYLYCGQLNDNRPHGYGILYKLSEVSYGILEYDMRYFDIIYIGEFDKGRYDGFGMLFEYPEETIGWFEEHFSYERGTDEFNKYYLICENYVKYFGEFSKGGASGIGNSFSLIDFDIFGDYMADEGYYNYSINVGEFKSQELNGKAKSYINGSLYYDGEWKNDKFHGKGTLYYLSSGKVEYEGEFYKDMRHGKGTSYSENGDIVYKGEWENDDYK